MRRRTRSSRLSIPLAAVVLVLPVLTGCSDPTGVEEDGVRVRVDRQRVEIRNTRPDTIHFFLVERDDAAFTEFVPCSDPASCGPGVAPGETRLVATSEIVGLDEGDEEAILRWWELVRTEQGGFEAGEVRSILFPLD